jgi:hypothetical protein
MLFPFTRLNGVRKKHFHPKYGGSMIFRQAVHLYQTIRCQEQHLHPNHEGSRIFRQAVPLYQTKRCHKTAFPFQTWRQYDLSTGSSPSTRQYGVIKPLPPLTWRKYDLLPGCSPLPDYTVSQNSTFTLNMKAVWSFDKLFPFTRLHDVIKQKTKYVPSSPSFVLTFEAFYFLSCPFVMNF